jgi:7,8-dihydroneopterin aldolase/epimerase/oxygenase
MREVALDGMRFHALIGILPHEHTTPQPIEIDLRVRVSVSDAVVDYRALYDATARVVQSGHIDYLEEIADRVADAAFAHSATISEARVSVRKPHVSLPGPLAYAEVVVERGRA